jgi:hypothetical protein
VGGEMTDHRHCRLPRARSGRKVLPIAVAKAMVQQRRTTSHASVHHFDADEREVPMRFFGSAVLRSLEHRAHVGLLPHSNGFCDNRLKRPIVNMNTRRKPQRHAKTVAGSMRCS